MIRYFSGLLTTLMLLTIGMNRPADAAFYLQSDGVAVTDLKVEYFENPIGIDDANPRLSWNLNSGQRSTLQTGYRLQVSRASQFSQSNLVWDTGKTNSEQSVHVRYRGPDLESGKRYYWRVMVWDNHGNRSAWSETAFWEMGLLNPEDWQAEWIEPGFVQDSTKPQPSPMLRNEFELDGEVASARAYVTGHGVYEMMINGRKVGNQVFSPGWTSYHNRLQYQTYDITGQLNSGTNAVGVTLGDGWYRGWIGFGGQRNFYGTRLGLLAQIVVTYSDGRTEVIGTDDSWKAATGPILMSDIYDGETYDARMEKEGWAAPGYDDGDWSPVRVADHSKDILVAPEGPPVRKIQELKPVEILTTPEGDTVADMGQNMVGWIRLSVDGPSGTEVTLHHAEVLDKEGNFYTANLRSADQKVTYILKGGGEEIYEPHFTFQGFRYVKVEGYPGEVTADDLTGIVLHSDMEPTGHFQSSNHLVNRLQHNIVWGQKGNFLDVPTDCPQRNERLGWTGDIEVFAQTACYNMNAAGFLTKWLRDLDADQFDSGSVPHVVPNVLGAGAGGASGWGDAAVIVPWTLYQTYGDEQILETQYESMKEWVDFMAEQSMSDSTTYLWDNGFTFGDWVAFTNDPGGARFYPGAYTNTDLISTAFFAHSTDLLRRSAEILGRQNDARKYGELFEAVRQAFQREYVTRGGRVMSDTQTSYLLALQFGLLPDEMESEAAAHLSANVDERGHLTTGFLGSPHLNPILSQYGYSGQAYELLLRTDYPSWLYPVTMGATTIWERWDGIKPDSTFQDPGMNSFNHYAYGAIGEWLYKTVAGIEPTSPGYKTIRIEPTPGGGISHARSIKNSIYGKIESSWDLSEDQFTLTVEVPVNTVATIILPGIKPGQVSESGGRLADAAGITRVEQEGSDVKLAAGSGRYIFSYPSGELASTLKLGEFSIETPVERLLENEQSRAVLQEHIPDLVGSELFDMVGENPLSQIAEFAPDQLPKSRLEPINADLQNIKIDMAVSMSRENKVAELIANKQARQILNEQLPELMNSAWLSQVMGFSLEKAAESLPVNFQIPENKLQSIDRELRALGN